jgi:hypothetical protein
MAVHIYTKKPKTLLRRIKSAIDDGTIKTWEYDQAGHFTHNSEQWVEKAWFEASEGNGVLMFGLIGERQVNMTKPVYGIYHGRFIQMLLTHFDDVFDVVSATAQGDVIDVF